MTVRPFVGASTTTVVASTANGRMVLTALTGRINVTLDATTTGNYCSSTLCLRSSIRFRCNSYTYP
jgi:hypothetical protein